MSRKLTCIICWLPEVVRSANQVHPLSIKSYHSGSGTIGAQRKHTKEDIFLQHVWPFKDPGKGKTETLPAGNYEFPFDIVLQGSLPESLEGLPDTWITYRLKAEIGRKYMKRIVARKPLRVIRTPDTTALELSHTMVSLPVYALLGFEGTNCHLQIRPLKTRGLISLNIRYQLQVRRYYLG
jgi:hypothetical protein